MTKKRIALMLVTLLFALMILGEYRLVMAQRVFVPIRWCAIEGTSAAAHPECVGESTTKDVLWRRHERISESVYIPQCNLTFRSAAIAAVPTFPIIPDPCPPTVPGCVGRLGDIVLDPASGYAELLVALNSCARAWLARGVGPIGIVAVNVRQFVNTSGIPLPFLGVAGRPAFCSSFSQRAFGALAVIDNDFTLPGSESLPCVQQFIPMPDPKDVLLGHLLGSTLSLPDVPGTLMSPIWPPPPLLNPLQCTQARLQALRHVPGAHLGGATALGGAQPTETEDIDASGLGATPPLVAEDLRELQMTDPLADRLHKVALIVDGNLSGFASSIGGVYPDTPVSGLEYLFALDLDNNPATGGNPTDLGLSLDFAGAELVGRVAVDIMGSVVATPTVWQFDPAQGQFVLQADPTIQAEVVAVQLGPHQTDTTGQPVPLAEQIVLQFPTAYLRVESAFPTTVRYAAQATNPSTSVVDEMRGTLTFPPHPLPDCHLEPASAQPGQTVTVVATGLPPGASAHVVFGAATVADGPIDATGQASIGFTVPASATPGSHLITVGAGDTAITADCALEVGVTLATVTLNPATVIGGGGSTGTVRLTGPAPAGGRVVNLASSHPTLAQVPASITVPGGAQTANFTVSVNPTAPQTLVTIAATLAGVTRSALLTVLPGGSIVPSTVTLNPASVTGGASAMGTVTLNSPAPAGGAVVTLFSTNPLVAGVPPSITIPAGLQTGTFNIATNPVAVPTGVNISASRSGVTRSAALAVLPAMTVVPNSVTLNPATVMGGFSSTGTLTLNGPAPAGGTVVTLASGNPLVAAVPGIVTVPAGAASTTFVVTTNSFLAVQTSVIIAASRSGVTRAATLTVLPTASFPTQLALPATIIGGDTATGTVTLNTFAPAGGALVALSSNNPGVAAVPANVLVSAGTTSASFTVTTSPVVGPIAVTFTASRGGATVTRSVTVVPPPVTLVALSLNPTTVTGGNPSTGTVTLSGPAPAGGLVVNLSSTNPAVAGVPGNVTVPAGASITNFTVPTNPVTAQTVVTIIASRSGVTRTATLTVLPVGAVTLSGLTLNPTTVVGGNPSTGTVTLSGPAPAGGAVVNLSSSQPAVAAVPASVTVPAGAASASFTVTTTPVGATMVVTITATRDAVTRRATLTVLPRGGIGNVDCAAGINGCQIPDDMLGGALQPAVSFTVSADGTTHLVANVWPTPDCSGPEVEGSPVMGDPPLMAGGVVVFLRFDPPLEVGTTLSIKWTIANCPQTDCITYVMGPDGPPPICGAGAAEATAIEVK